MTSPREQWLARRREMVTASDVAAILGFHPTRTAAAVYAEKLGHEQEETPAMRRGRAHEALIAEEYAATTGRPVRDLGAYEIQVHPDVPWLGATLDRVVGRESASGGEGAAGVAASVDWGGGGGASDELAFDGTSGSVASRQRPEPAADTDDRPRASEPGSAPCHELTQAGIKPGLALSLLAPLEIKRHLGRAAHWREGIPLDVQIQLQVEIACYRAEWGAAAAEVSNGPIVHFDQSIHTGFVESILPALEVFRRQVKDRVVPDVESAWADRWALKALFPGVDGRTVELDADTSALVDELEASRAGMREWQREMDRARNKLERAMAGAQFAYTSDGRLLTRTKTHRRAFEVEETDYIRLVVSRPRRRR